jgi:hypothetical protein
LTLIDAIERMRRLARAEERKFFLADSEETASDLLPQKSDDRKPARGTLLKRIYRLLGAGAPAMADGPVLAPNRHPIQTVQ